MDGYMENKITDSAYRAYKTQNYNNLRLSITSTWNGKKYYKLDTLDGKTRFFKSLIKSLINTHFFYGEGAKREIYKNTEIQNHIESIRKTKVQAAIKKFHSAVEKAKILGKGLLALRNMHAKGVMLKEEFWKEAIKPQDKKYLKENVLAIKEGLVERNGVLYNTKTQSTKFSGSGVSNYVIDAKKQFFSIHSSRIGGKAIIGAGEIMTNQKGEITAISNRSTHYRPDEENMIDVLLFLEEQGVDLSKMKLVIYDYDNFLDFFADIPDDDSDFDNSYVCNALQFLEVKKRGSQQDLEKTSITRRTRLGNALNYY